ncbi:MAG TPA: MerR family transcriptional regulator [Desulfobacterales bacterium]|nr:MerR family transcriptional regulator [Desulfobacterales bacterium]
MKNYPTRLIRNLTKATNNQLKYWVRIGLVYPQKNGKRHFYSFRDIIKLKLIVTLKENGLSLQKIQKGIKRLSNLLPDSDDPLTRLIIYTDGVDMFVNEKGKYFSATTMQRFFQFDTEQIESEIIELQKKDSNQSKLKHVTKPRMAS